MDEKQAPFDQATIKGAVAGEAWATKKVLAHYADYIAELSTVEVRQKDGSTKKQIDEDMRQQITMKLLEALPKFQMGQN